jgi:hypothetical protein
MNPEYRKLQNEMLKAFTDYDSEMNKLAHYVVHKYKKEVIENQKRKVEKKNQLYRSLRNQVANFKNKTLIVSSPRFQFQNEPKEKDYKLDDSLVAGFFSK